MKNRDIESQFPVGQFAKNYLFDNLREYPSLVLALKENIKTYLESQDIQKLAGQITNLDDLSQKFRVMGLLQDLDDDNDMLVKMYHLANFIKEPEIATQIKNALCEQYTKLDNARAVHIFEIMQSSLHLEQLANPTYENLQHLIQGRRDINLPTYREVENVVYMWACGQKYNRRCTVEIKGNSVKNVKPEHIYKIYPAEEYRSDVRKAINFPGMPDAEFKKLSEGILNPFFQKPQFMTPKTTMEFYLPLPIVDKTAVEGEIPASELKNLNLAALTNIINSALKKGNNLQMGRVVNEAKKLYQQKLSPDEQNNYLIVQVEVEEKSLSFTRNEDQHEYFFGLKSTVLLSEKNIIGFQTCEFSGPLKKESAALDSENSTQLTNCFFNTKNDKNTGPDLESLNMASSKKS